VTPKERKKERKKERNCEENLRMDTVKYQAWRQLICVCMGELLVLT
jgi:hypothetical protein